jgi:hypothetical protein
MLIDANREDQKLYDYVQHELFPRYGRQYGPRLEADLQAYQQSQDHDFNRLNLTLSRLKQYLVYKPVIQIARRAAAGA